MKNMAKTTIRRSIALPNELVEELHTIAPPELRDNFNRLVTFILYRFHKTSKNNQFEQLWLKWPMTLQSGKCAPFSPGSLRKRKTMVCEL